jgi:transposase InsO family protein
MFHLGSDKVSAALKKQYFWPSLASDTRKFLKDCPDCELEKARQITAHGLFSARPFDAPRARWAMDFQGQGVATSGETEALAIIDTTARYVIILPLHDREASTFIQPVLDRVIFVHGSPDILHSDAAPEFTGEALRLLTEAVGISTTTTLGHAANANGTVEVFWRYWNRCMRLLPDDLYLQWPVFASRICYAYNTASHTSLGGISPFEIYHGVPARDAFTGALHQRALDDELASADLNDPVALAEAVRISTTAFTLLARNHTDYVRTTTANRMNLHGHPRTYVVGDRVKIRVPPSHEQMLASGRKSSHITSWRGPCIIFERLSTTAYKMIEESTSRTFERVVSNILPYRATSVPIVTTFEPLYSDPFVVSEIIALRDEPNSLFYLANVVNVTDFEISVHYFDCTNRNISKAIFRPVWHLPDSEIMILSTSQPNGTIPYTGIIQLDSLRNLIVARDLEFTKKRQLRRKSQQVLFPVHDELFIFDT